LNPYKNHTLDELLRMRLNEDVLDRLLEILAQRQRTDLESRQETTHSVSA